MIHAFNFTGSRDLELSALMSQTLEKYCPRLKSLNCINMDGKGWGNGAGWEASLLKIDYLREAATWIKPYEYLLSIDSDVVFCSGDFFEYFPQGYGIIGIMNQGPATQTAIGELRHCSGCSVYVRGDIVKLIAAITDEQLAFIRAQFKLHVLAENEDILVSYLAKYVGASFFNIQSRHYDGLFEEDLKNNALKSFYHLNYHIDRFLDEKVSGKWDIPKILKLKGIEL